LDVINLFGIGYL